MGCNTIFAFGLVSTFFFFAHVISAPFSPHPARRLAACLAIVWCSAEVDASQRRCSPVGRHGLLSVRGRARARSCAPHLEEAPPPPVRHRWEWTLDDESPDANIAHRYARSETTSAVLGKIYDG